MSPKARKRNRIKRFLPSRLFLIIGIAVLVLFSVSLGKEVVRRYEVNKEIQALEKEVEELENQNTELADLIQYLNTNSFREKEARTKLGMAKEGEKVVVIPNIEVVAETATEAVGVPDNVEELSNPERWFAYFFNQ
ncbi:septum formation initiator family protein [Patescibacteria group bacterium]|nr:septum formation initiator family protein [Patescibacteria group bacterium]MBU1075276.1 septum formation initiator family protein [Patescibacteria group bacterium]MBU1951785.1 septum formation initiator family protein [Patescibacteria group bacterium]